MTPDLGYLEFLEHTLHHTRRTSKKCWAFTELAKIYIRGDPMPSVSKAQRRLMLAAAHNQAIAKKTGVPQKVAREYVAADKGKSTAKLPARKGK